jgi:pimeloyl-ACP methyl ester carboxylesterase
MEPIERRLAARPCIAMPTVVLDGAVDGVGPPTVEDHHAAMFTGPYRRVLVPRAGHLVPRKMPQAVMDAVQSLPAG